MARDHKDGVDGPIDGQQVRIYEQGKKLMVVGIGGGDGF